MILRSFVHIENVKKSLGVKAMYNSDLSAGEWALIEHHFQPKDKRGAAPKHDKRIVVNAILYINKTGAQWRMLPNDFPPWQTVYGHYYHWSHNGIWEAVIDELNELHRKKTINHPPQAMGL